MESNNSGILRESVFFTARPKAKFTCNIDEASVESASSSHPASSSSWYYSPRIHSIMERMSNLNLSEEDAEIEASRDHWTEVQPECDRGALNSLNSSTSESMTMEGATEADQELYEENLAALRSLQMEDPDNGFFEYNGEYVLGRKIAEGGQGAIYEADECVLDDGEVVAVSPPVILKVFKAGCSLVDLREQWPLALLHKLHPTSEVFGDYSLGSSFCNSIHGGMLLSDGRFAFSMRRRWGDLRKLMDVRLQHNGNQRPPFMMPDGNYLECCILEMMQNIATGMRYLHREGVLHRDLKASNVLIHAFEHPKFDPVQSCHDLLYVVADFECSVGVVGTGFWRAPEVLKAVRDRTWSTTPNVFTRKSDVYSYAMTCYEILTGCKPFECTEDIQKTSFDDVIQGKRPRLPGHLKRWIKELLERCWHMDPSERPTFEEIVSVLDRMYAHHPSCLCESEFYKPHWADLIESEQRVDCLDY